MARTTGCPHLHAICRQVSAATYRRYNRTLRNRVREQSEQRRLPRLVGGQMEEHPELMTQVSADVQSQVG